MRAVAQRVSAAEVEVDGAIVGRIGAGLVVYLGAARGDGDSDLEYVTSKIIGLRVFPDDAGKMSRSVADIGGSILLISQFTLFGDVRRGLRPSFDEAAAPDEANLRYQEVGERLRARGIPVETGRFRAHMDVRCSVDGPVTILIDSRKLF